MKGSVSRKLVICLKSPATNRGEKLCVVVIERSTHVQTVVQTATKAKGSLLPSAMIAKLIGS
jgi:hypothetical protein